MLPDHLFSTMFRSTAENMLYITRQTDSLYINTESTERSQKTIRFLGAFMWNIPITKINVSCKIGTFKIHLRNLLQNIDLQIFYRSKYK